MNNWTLISAGAGGRGGGGWGGGGGGEGGNMATRAIIFDLRLLLTESIDCIYH